MDRRVLCYTIMLVSRKAYRAKCATTLEVSEKAALWIELAEQIFLEDLAKKCRKMVIKQGKKGKKTLRRRDVARAYQLEQSKKTEEGC